MDLPIEQLEQASHRSRRDGQVIKFWLSCAVDLRNRCRGLRGSLAHSAAHMPPQLSVAVNSITVTVHEVQRGLKADQAPLAGGLLAKT